MHPIIASIALARSTDILLAGICRARLQLPALSCLSGCLPAASPRLHLHHIFVFQTEKRRDAVSWHSW